MTRQDIKREKKEFISFIIIGVLMHIISVYTVVIQLFPEVTAVGIFKAIFFGILITGVLVVYWINISRYAKAIANAEKKLED